MISKLMYCWLLMTWHGWVEVKFQTHILANISTEGHREVLGCAIHCHITQLPHVDFLWIPICGWSHAGPNHKCCGCDNWVRIHCHPSLVWWPKKQSKKLDLFPFLLQEMYYISKQPSCIHSFSNPSSGQHWILPWTLDISFGALQR